VGTGKNEIADDELITATLWKEARDGYLTGV